MVIVAIEVNIFYTLSFWSFDNIHCLFKAYGIFAAASVSLFPYPYLQCCIDEQILAAKSGRRPNIRLPLGSRYFIDCGHLHYPNDHPLQLQGT
jgi:hypothetical protein